ncbi:MAG: hypothetical protein HQK98_06985 [Nitrospirae bacterium]|nr:hypothetical protein [Nitrospirota bacterium]
MATEEVVIKDSTDADVIAAVKLLHDKCYVVTHNGNPVEIAVIEDMQTVVSSIPPPPSV